MEGIDLTSIYTTIGGVLGTPAAIAFFYLWNKVKELEKRLDAGQTRFDRNFNRGASMVSNYNDKTNRAFSVRLVKDS